MKKLIKIASVFLLLMLFSFVTPDKKMNKLAEKIWADKELSMRQVDLPDSLELRVTQFNEVSANDEILGYACYTSAFGCRVGGCPGPANPNVESYETFDYIVIYDSNLKILKIDVVNYPGQYGYEICRASWLKQFNGKTSGFKLNENVDGISGATISASYLIDDLNELGSSLQEFINADSI